MSLKRLGLLVSLVLLSCGSALAWNCSDPLASRVDVGPVNPGGSAGDGDGQWFLGTGSEGVKGDYYVCQVPKKTTGGGGSTTTNTNTNTNQNSNTQGQQQGQQQGQTANGGSATSTATGGNATGGNATATGGAGGAGGSVSGSGNSNVKNNVKNTNNVNTTVAPVITSTNKLSDSGNSSNTNNNTANGGSANGNGSNNTTSASSNQTQSNSSTNANQSSASNQANGNGSNSNNTTNNIAAPKIPVPTAYAPTTIPTSPCLKGYEGGGQGAAFGFSLGGSKVDKNCQKLELARSFDSMNERLAGCKVKVDAAKKIVPDAHITVEDCMEHEMIDAPVPVAVVPPPAPQQPIVVVVPAAAAPAAPVVPVAAPAPSPAIVWTSVCTFAGKVSCNVPGSDAVVVDPAHPTSVCKVMIDSAARAFKKSPGARFVLVGNRNREESDLLPTARANNVRKLLEASGVPASAISVQVGSGTTRTVEIVLIQQ